MDTEVSGRIVDYELAAITTAPDLCRPLECTLVVCRDEPFATPLRINIGGGATTDSLGRRWAPDNPTRGINLPGDVPGMDRKSAV